MIATFLNPFGYDILVYKLTQLTNDYWSTMYVLYILAFLSFLLSYPFYKLGKRTIGNMLITLALFLNPFGYDIIVYGINMLTNSYWMTMSIMYSLAISFFGMFIYFSDIDIILQAKNKHTKLKTKFKRNE
jgi:TRAP-type C4-dicarboxylate transport system permease small subunit